VKQGDATVGILLRQGDHTGKTVRDAMQPLREELMVSADMLLADLIPKYATVTIGLYCAVAA